MTRINNKISFARRLVALLATLVACSLFAITASKRPGVIAQPRAAALVAVISRGDSADGQANMDAVVLVDNGKLRQPYAEENEAAQNNFGALYFKVGKNYRVTFGGGEIGSATIKGFQSGCNNIHGTATLTDNGRIPANLSALATDSELLGHKASSRRAPNEAERAAIMKIVRQIYLARSTIPALLKSITTTTLTATDLDGDGQLELIGSFVLATKAKARRDLLLIAEPQKTRAAQPAFKAALVDFQSYKMPPEEFDSAKDFVDQLDLDGDGVGEVFVVQHGFDAYGYAIYKKARGRWRQIYTAAGDAC
jgi:hypothetical protein